MTQHLIGTPTSASGPVTSGTARLKFSVTVTASDGTTSQGTLVVRETSLGTGTVHLTVHFTGGSITSAGTYVAGLGSAGSVTLTVKGHFKKGTGHFKGIRGKFTGTGTVDIKTTALTLDITGTAIY